jgi:hypothetical protein
VKLNSFLHLSYRPVQGKTKNDSEQMDGWRTVYALLSTFYFGFWNQPLKKGINVNNRRWAVVCLYIITGLLSFLASAHADPIIKLIERSHTLHENKSAKGLPPGFHITAEKEVSSLMLSILKDRLRDRMQELELVSANATDLTPLYRTLEIEIARLVKMGLWGDSFSAIRLLTSGDSFSAIRLLTSASFLDGLIADWVGIPAVSPFMEKSEEAGITITSNPSRLYVESAEIVQEVGGDGAGNGRLDRGEWVAISLNLKNGSSIPWFSTSVYVTVDNPKCAWVKKTEIEPGEFLEMGSEVEVPVWVYVSPTCPGVNAIRLSLTKVDSHRTNESGISSTVRIPVEQNLKSKVVDVFMDTDVPGESKGHQVKIISPDMFAELSHGVRFSGRQAYQVEETVRTAQDQMGLFSTPAMLASRLSVTSGTNARAGDDLDLKIIRLQNFRAVQAAYKPSRKFMGNGRGELWFAADMVIATFESKGGPGAATLRNAKLRNPKPAKILSATQALNLVKKHLIFESREMQPKAGAIAAVTGHDVLIDKKAFEEAWNAEVQGKLTKETEALDAPPLVYYKVRRFFKVPIFYDLQPVILSMKPKPRPKPKRKPVPKPKPVVEKKTNHIIDIGGGGLILPSSGNGRNHLTLTTFTTDWFIGNTWTFMGHFHRGTGTSTDDIRVEGSRVGMALGVGYKVVSQSGTFHFHPHLGLGFDSVTVKEEGTLGLDRGEFAAVLNMGAALRLMPTKYFGFHVAVDALLTNVDNGFTGIVYTGINPMFAGGISLRF